MTPEREKALNSTGSNFSWAESEEAMVGIADLRARAEKAEAKLQEPEAPGLKEAVRVLAKQLEATTRRAERAETRCKLLEDQWLKAAFSFHKHHKAVLGAVEKI